MLACPHARPSPAALAIRVSLAAFAVATVAAPVPSLAELPAESLRGRLEQAGITFGLLEQTEIWANLTGGIRPGGALDGLLTASIAVDLGKAAGWGGASLFASGFQIHGLGPTPSLVGNLQTISSIEATPSAKLYDLWFEQKLFNDRFSLRFGQEGANDEMMVTKYGALYLNSSFGYPALLALDLPSGGPNYPLASPFVRASLRPTDEVTLIGAVYSADPAPPGGGDPQLRDRHGTAFRLNDHALSFGELQYAPALMANLGLPATYKLGAWVASGRFADPLHDASGLSLADPASSGEALQHGGSHGVYAVIDQTVWQSPSAPDQGIGVFLQVMRAPDDRNLFDLFIEGGVNWTGLFPDRPQDVFGLAATHVGIGAAARRFSRDIAFFTGSGRPYSPGETVIEATYLLQIAPWLSLQPDAQLVVNPGAGIPSVSSPAPLKNDLIIGVRVAVNF